MPAPRQRPRRVLRPRARQLDEISHAARGQRWMRQHHVCRRGDLHNRRKIFFRMKRQLRRETDIRRMADRHHQQRIAVGRGLRRHFGADDAARAGAVFHDDVLAQLLLQRLGAQARDEIRAAAGSVGHDDAHRLGGEILRADAERSHPCAGKKYQ